MKKRLRVYTRRCGKCNNFFKTTGRSRGSNRRCDKCKLSGWEGIINNV